MCRKVGLWTAVRKAGVVSLGGIMKTREVGCVLVLFFATVLGAVNTTVTLSDKSWLPSQQTLVGDVGLFGEGAASGPMPEAPDSSEEGLTAGFSGHLDLSSLHLSDPVVSTTADGQQNAGPVTLPLIDALGSGTSLPGRASWGGDANGYAGSLSVDGRWNQSSPAEIDWMAARLPAAREVSMMEVVVFPALGVLVVVLIVGMLIVRVRKRRPVNQAQQLLRV